MLRRAATTLLLVAAAGAAPAAGPAKAVPAWTGRVSHVSDGDSLWVQPAAAGAKAVEIRLADIDAPEICQPWGPQARDALMEQVGGKTVAVQVLGHDSYGRTLARVLLEGQSVNAWLVQEGHAWSNRSRWDQGPLVKQEKMARALRRGLHGQQGPERAMLPREFRRSHGPCERPAAAPKPQ